MVVHTDVSILDDIKAAAQELQDMVQTKVGTTKFTAVYSQIRQGNLTARRERKAALAIMVCPQPLDVLSMD